MGLLISAKRERSSGDKPTNIVSVSYTHLDVYKRQLQGCVIYLEIHLIPRWNRSNKWIGGYVSVRRNDGFRTFERTLLFLVLSTILDGSAAVAC